MVSLLVIVFLVQLAIYLINSLGAKTINELLWQLYSKLPLLSNQDLQEQLRLRRDVVRLKREMGAISAQDDFARWAKIRRQHDKALAEYEQKAASVTETRATFDTRAGYARWASTTGLRYGLQFWYAKTPIFTYPRGWVPWYVEWALGFPRCPSGGVSINIWTMACATVIELVGDFVSYNLDTVQGSKMPEKGDTVKVPAGGMSEKKEL